MDTRKNIQKHLEESRAERKRSRMGMARDIFERSEIRTRKSTEGVRGEPCCYTENRRYREGRIL